MACCKPKQIVLTLRFVGVLLLQIYGIYYGASMSRTISNNRSYRPCQYLTEPIALTMMIGAAVGFVAKLVEFVASCTRRRDDDVYVKKYLNPALLIVDGVLSLSAIVALIYSQVHFGYQKSNNPGCTTEVFNATFSWFYFWTVHSILSVVTRSLEVAYYEK